MPKQINKFQTLHKQTYSQTHAQLHQELKNKNNRQRKYLAKNKNTKLQEKNITIFKWSGISWLPLFYIVPEKRSKL